MLRPAGPEVLQARAAALVGVGVHELRGHKDLVAVGEAAHAGQVGGVVVGVEVVEVGPGMDHVALLRVVRGEEGIEVGVPAALVAVVPEDDAGVVDVAPHHLGHESGTDLIVVAAVPACQLVEVEDAQRVAHIQEMGVRGIVGTDGVHIHLLDQQGVLQADGGGGAAPALRVEDVAVDTFENHLDVVDVKTVAGAQFHGAEARAQLLFVQDLAGRGKEFDLEGVEVGVLALPGGDPGPGEVVVDGFAG